jgi:hypothetical protein
MLPKGSNFPFPQLFTAPDNNRVKLSREKTHMENTQNKKQGEIIIDVAINHLNYTLCPPSHNHEPDQPTQQRAERGNTSNAG